MQTEFLFSPTPRGVEVGASLAVGPVRVPVEYVRHRRARRYILRLTHRGTARITIPRGGSTAEGRRFAERQIPWIERQLRRQQEGALRPRAWRVGGRILFRGVLTGLTASTVNGESWIRLADQTVPVANLSDDTRPALERHLWALAKRELPPRLLALATQHGLSVRGVTVRNQKARWGSCSRRGRISLNWRLIQVPDFVRDYILLHELTHLREMNHSPRFWRAVADVCPTYRQAQQWLQTHADLLRRNP